MPTHALTDNFAAAKDAYVWNAAPTNNIGATSTAEVGRTVPKSGPVLLKRALLHFDVSTLPAHVTINAATLRLYVERASADPLGLGLTAWRLSSDFTEGDNSSGVTWDTQPAVETSPTDTGTMSTAAGQWFEIDVTDVVAAERASADPGSVGLRVAPTDETTVELRDFGFRTREHGAGAHAAQLVIDYTLQTPTFTPTPVPPPTATPTETATPTQTATPTAIASATATETGLPPDPVSVAPPLDRSVATDVFASSEFLYTGPDPIQTGVAPGTIEPRRAAVLRGQVNRRDGSPLAGVVVTILDHPEYGTTKTRGDGVFDLVVNGGGRLTIDYTKEGFLPAQRQVDVPWQDFVWAADLVLVQEDGPPIAVAFPDPQGEVQILQGLPIVDAQYETRQATVLVLPSTTAQLVPSQGPPTTVSELTLRATEYTTGAEGFAAMPAELPPSADYTYAVELRAQGVVADTRVQFSQPVSFYVENFLGFDVGATVPVAFYDRRSATWVPSANGRVIEIVDITPSGLAEVDTDGDGSADAGLGIGDAERAALGQLYAVDQTLWRAPLTHFSTVDINWPSGPNPDGTIFRPRNDPPKEDKSDCAYGSVIECQNQTLGERVPIAGTPFALHYRSDRVLGRAADRTVTLAFSSIPPEATKVLLRISVAGRRYPIVELEPAPELTYTFVWDGLDAYGRGCPSGC